ncbi:MAG: hypothetical protein ACI92G_004007, partial [Candidatus Pelagisphaera sp.]
MRRIQQSGESALTSIGASGLSIAMKDKRIGVVGLGR